MPSQLLVKEQVSVFRPTDGAHVIKLRDHVASVGPHGFETPCPQLLVPNERAVSANDIAGDKQMLRHITYWHHPAFFIFFQGVQRMLRHKSRQAAPTQGLLNRVVFRHQIVLVGEKPIFQRGRLRRAHRAVATFMVGFEKHGSSFTPPNLALLRQLAIRGVLPAPIGNSLGDGRLSMYRRGVTSTMRNSSSIGGVPCDSTQIVSAEISS